MKTQVHRVAISASSPVMVAMSSSTIVGPTFSPPLLLTPRRADQGHEHRSRRRPLLRTRQREEIPAPAAPPAPSTPTTRRT